MSLLAPLLLAAWGALQTVAFVHPNWAWPLPLAGAAALAWLCAHARPARAALLGWAYGFGWLAVGTWWLFVSMNRYGGIAAPLAALAVAALAAFLSLYPAAAMATFARLRPGRPLPDALLFAALWLLAELARGVLFTGFPWAAGGYAQIDGPLAGLLPWIGVYGVGAWGAGLAALAALSPGRGVLPAALAAAALVLPALHGFRPIAFGMPTGTLAVTLLQPNVPQNEKFDATFQPATLQWLDEALRAARGDLVVAPETAIPLLPDQLDQFVPGWWQVLRARFAAPGAPAALVGLPLGDYEHGYTNSVAGLAAALPYRYDKRHLVPFGEFIPAGFRWFTQAMGIPLGDFERGPHNPPSFALKGERLAPNICYEDLFGEELAERFADPAAAPTVFVNLSNIGWFGDTVAVPQHLNISRARALEFERPMLRATNTGATAVIDHRGRVTALLPPSTQGVLTGSVQGRSGTTPYAWWTARAGLWPLAGLAAAIVAAAALQLPRAARRTAP